MTLTSEDIQAIAEVFDQKLEILEEKFDQKLEPINNRLDKLESEVSALRVGQREIRKELKAVNDKVTDTYQLALDAWATSAENRKWLDWSRQIRNRMYNISHEIKLSVFI